MAAEYQVYDTSHTPVPNDHPNAAQRRKVDLEKWAEGLNELAADGWDVIAPVPPSLTGGHETALLLRRTSGAVGKVTGD